MCCRGEYKDCAGSPSACHFERSRFGLASFACCGVVRNPQHTMGLASAECSESSRTSNTERIDHRIALRISHCAVTRYRSETNWLRSKGQGWG